MNNREVPWTLKDAGKGLFILILLILLSFSLQTLPIKIPFASPIVRTLQMLLIYGFLVSVAWYYGVRAYRGRLRDLGFSSFNLWLGLKLGFLWLILVRTLAALYAIIAIAVFKFEPSPELITGIPRLFGRGYLGLIFALSIAAVVAPIAEEVFFRGFIYSALRKSIGITKGIIISALIFALFHAQSWLLIPVTIIGVVLAYLYEKTGSLGPPIILHALNNLISVVLIYSIYSIYG